MRAKHFITEYSREKTAQVHGANILTALNKNKTPGRDLDVWNLMTSSKDAMNLYNDQERADFMNKVMAQIEQGDPTKNKEYSQWIARMYSRGGYELEDIKSTLRDALETYHKLKLKKKLEDQDKQIDKFKSIDQLIARVEQYPEIQDDAPTDKGEAREIYKDDQIRVLVPKDVEAACYYGQGTRWCTAAKNNNLFKRYYEAGDIYIILPQKPKTPGDKFQFHFHSGQFMDSQDRPLDMYKLLNAYPTIRDVPVFNEWAKRKMVPALMSDEDYAKWDKESDATIIHSQRKHGDMYTISLNAITGSYDSFKLSNQTAEILREKSMMSKEDWGDVSETWMIEADMAYGWFDAVSDNCLGVTYISLSSEYSGASTIQNDSGEEADIQTETEVLELEKFLNGLSRIARERNSSGLADDQFKKGIDQMLDEYGYPVSLTGYVGGEPQRA